MEEKVEYRTREISEMEVLRSAAGYYIGRQQYDPHLEQWLPYSRISNYMSQKKAEDLLNKSQEFIKTIEPIRTNSLKIIMNDLSKKLHEDPYNELKRNLISDTLEHDRGYIKEISHHRQR